MTEKFAAIVELQDSVAVPEFVRVAGEIALQDRLAGIVSANEIVPVNPSSAETVIVEVAEVPARTTAGEVAETEKSVTVNVTVAK